MFRIKYLSFIFFFWLSNASVFGQVNVLSDKTSVSVITCGTGNEVYSFFGHTAIRIKDPASNLDVVYNYGMFDFDTPNFVVKFSKGDLQYFVGSTGFNDFAAQYIYEKRSVAEQILNLSLEQKQKLFDKLNAALYSEDRFYTYKFIDRNCTTMVVDILNEILGEKAIVKTKKTDETYREILYPYFNNHFYEQLGTSIIFGTKVDQNGTKIFLPLELEKSINEVKYKNEPLLVKHNKILNITTETPFSWWNNIYTYLAFLLLVVLARANNLNMFYFAVVAFIGLIFSVMGLYSFHHELEYNYNILLFNPVLFLLIWFFYRKNTRWIFRISAFAIGCIGIYLIVMINKIHLLIVLPLVATNLFLLTKLALKHKPKSQQ